MGFKRRKKAAGQPAKPSAKAPALLAQLSGGDRRSIGRSNAVAKRVLADPRLFRELFDGLLTDDPIVRMRAADAVEKVTAKRPEWLRPYKQLLLEHVANSEQQEVRWHVAQMIPRLDLTQSERARVERLLFRYLEDRSAIVKTFALQALADLAVDDDRLRRRVIKLLEDFASSGTPAVRSRARKLLAKKQ